MPSTSPPSSSSRNPFSGPQLNSGTSSTSQIDAAWASLESMLDKRIQQEFKPKTPAQIKANGDSRNKTIVISAMVVILGIIIIYAGALYALNKDGGKEFTTMLMPVITAIISGTFGYLSGERSSK